MQLFIDIRHKNKDNNDDSIQFVVPVRIQNRYNRGAAAHASARGQLAIKKEISEMSMFDKIKGMMGVPDDDDYDDDDMDFVNENTGYAAQDDYVPEEQDVTPKRNKVVNINSTMQLQVVLVKPERFDDASAIADHLNAKRTVVLNLESTNKEVSRRLVDFLSGVAYANNGQIKRVANSTFIITPYNVDIMGDLLDELESNGVFF